MHPIFTHIQLAIAQGVGFDIVAATPLVEGLPPHVAKASPERIVLRFDAEFHSRSVMAVDDDTGVMDVQLSFDTLYAVRIPAHAIAVFAIRQHPGKPQTVAKPQEEPAKKVSHLRLVE